jgi:hypothetical protein
MTDKADIQELKNKAAALVRDITPAISRMIEEAYQQGYSQGFAAGKQEAGQELLQFVASMNTANIPVLYDVTMEGTAALSNESDKQPPGTVKPAVLKAIQDSSTGLSIRQIEQKTGFKYNSIRGTVWLLQKEGLVVKGEGNLWVAALDQPGDKPDDQSDEKAFADLV